MSPLALALPAALQAAAMLWDEAIFHRRRGLPRWERLGHPLDTLTILACLAWTLWQPFGSAPLEAYALLAAFSCLFVTKDEPVHASRCTPGEHWLHAVLFVLHPVVLAAAGLLWWQASAGSALASAVLEGELASTLVFLGWQVAYWNFGFRKEAVPHAAGNQ